MYPSDYGYASTNTSCRDNMSSSTNNVYNCKNENWLFNSDYQCTLSPRSDTSCNVFYVSSGGYVNIGNAYIDNGVRPVLFLKSNVEILSGDGTSEKPFILE